ncbi:MAG: tripartite tricarboxylate transporter TctB family protein [Gammaproteobacteria bacterium]|nr:tripartite tricarboxylate transporter TctB family protein [Gammaproteobacteria bacterium]
MTLSKEQIGAIFFLLLSVAYGFYASEIKLYPGDELDSMTARTLPLVLSTLGIAFSLILLISGRNKSTVVAANLDWKPVIFLIVLTLLYGLTLDWLGFFISTSLFLIAGFRTLGEKRVKVLLLVSLPFVFIFWFGLTQLLDIYLAPGRLWVGQ